MTTVAPGPAIPALDALKEEFRGELLQPDTPGYDTARIVFNGMFQYRPVLIARCSGVADVIAALRYGREQGLQIAIRGGGHSVQGYSSCDGGLVIDLTPMKGIRVDAEARTAWAQAGVTWGDFDRETQLYGLATTGGRVSTTGIAGLTLGSGSGWLERSLGLTCDNLLAAELVTASGDLVRASESENPELLWGLKGGGGNFGIVTSFEYRLHRVGPIVLGGMLLYPGDQAAELLSLYREHMNAAPDEFGGAIAFLTAPPEPFVPQELRLQPAVGVIVCHTGDLDEGEELIRPLRERGPLVDLVQPMPYLAVQQILDPMAEFGHHNYWKTEVVHELGADAQATIVEQAGRTPPGYSITVLEPGGRAIARVADDDTPIQQRNAECRYYAIADWEDPDQSQAHIDWARGFAAAMEPYASPGIQLNFVSDVDDDRVRATFGPEKYARLQALKDEFDPDNMFRLNANVKPSGGGR